MSVARQWGYPPKKGWRLAGAPHWALAVQTTRVFRAMLVIDVRRRSSRRHRRPPARHALAALDGPGALPGGRPPPGVAARPGSPVPPARPARARRPERAERGIGPA